MVQIKTHAEKFSRGLKTRLAVLVVAFVAVALSSTFTFAGLYLYNKDNPDDKTPAGIAQTTNPDKLADSTAVKNKTPTTSTPTTSPAVPKPQPPPAPVVIKPVAPAPSAIVDSLTPATTAPVVTAPTQPSASGNPVRVSTTTYNSTNWSGYLATGGNFTAVSGSWVVPTVTGPAGIESGDGAWIGIGGVTSGDLIQTGTLHFVNPDGSTMYGVFYEILPAAAMIVDMPVSPGDLISASITETSLNQWFITVSNLTKVTTWTKNLYYVSSHSSAEWVEEAPSYLSGDLVPLTNFGTVTFSGCRATVDGYLYNIADIGASRITMMAAGRAVAIPSSISGTGFSVTRHY